MNKKGLTLIEILAVIVIIGILAIIVIPAVINIFNDSSAETFVVDIKSRFKTIDLNVMKQSIKENDGTVFYRLEGDEDKVPLTGKKIYYYVKINNSNKVVEMLVWDGNNVLKKKDSNGILISALSTDDLVDDIDTDGLTLERIKSIMD
jgi:type IV pilus assembly protein PilA